LTIKKLRFLLAKKYNIGAVMLNVLDSSAVDRRSDPQSVPSKIVKLLLLHLTHSINEKEQRVTDLIRIMCHRRMTCLPMNYSFNEIAL